MSHLFCRRYFESYEEEEAAEWVSFVKKIWNSAKVNSLTAEWLNEKCGVALETVNDQFDSAKFMGAKFEPLVIEFVKPKVSEEDDLNEAHQELVGNIGKSYRPRNRREKDVVKVNLLTKIVVSSFSVDFYLFYSSSRRKN
jgi:hypothetical protein